MRLLCATMRRVGRVDVLRAEPIGVLRSFDEMPDALRPLGAVRADAAAADAADVAAVPHTLQ